MYINWPILIILGPAFLFGLLCLLGGFICLILLIHAWLSHERKARRQYQDIKQSLVEYAEALARERHQ